MSAAGARVRVGIVSWNTAELLDRCLAALPAALDGVPAEVVVVDNASADDSVAVARRHGVLVAGNDDNVGYARAMNQALVGVAGDAPDSAYLLALNPDTVASPGSLRRLVERLDADRDLGIAVPRLVHPDGRHQHSAYRFPNPIVPVVAAVATGRLRRSRLGRSLLLEGSGPHRPGTVDWAIGAVHLIRRSALAGEPPYSERTFIYAEDLDLCWRLAQRGRRTELVDDAVVAHVGNASGARAFGDDRSATYWRATYETIAARRSSAFARAVALGCTVATVLSLLRLLARRCLRSPMVAIRRKEFRVHVEALASTTRREG